MISIPESISILKRDWSAPRKAYHGNRQCPFYLACRFSDKGSNRPDSLVPSLPQTGMREFWGVAESALLFVDEMFGQWGLALLTPRESIQATNQLREVRPEAFVGGDLVIGRFLGDSELLILRCDKAANDYGKVVVALSLDERMDWPYIADSFTEFFDKLTSEQGSKYWESPGEERDLSCR